MKKRKFFQIFLVLFIVFAWIFNAWLQILQSPGFLFKTKEAKAASTTYSSPGSFQWQAPSDVCEVIVEAWGSGSGGGAGNSGGGGGGGAYTRGQVSVTPNSFYTVVVGTGGAYNNNGLPSSFVGDGGLTVLANSGNVGLSNAGGTGGAAMGVGGHILASYSGGAGGSPGGGVFKNWRGGGGGGGSAWSTANGNIGGSGGNRVRGTGGTGQATGGIGGIGATVGTSGGNPGAGGGGNGNTGGGGAGGHGQVILTYEACPAADTILGPGASEPSNQTIGPGNAAVDMANFTLRTSSGTDTMTAATVTLLPAGAFNNIAEVAITNTANVSQCTPVTNPGSNTINFSSCSLGITTSETTYKIRITPKTHANMPATPGASYAVNGIVSAFTSTNSQAGSDSGTGIITIDNLAPNSATATSGSAGDQAVTLNWTSTNNETTNSVLLRWAAGSAGADVPAEGASYTAGNTIGGATVACVVSSAAANTALSRTDGSGASAGCTNTPLTNGTQYSYKIFQQDSLGNYDTGVVISGSPFTPQVSPLTTLGPGASEPSNQTIGPGNAAVDMANFTLRTNISTDTMTSATVTLLPAGAFNNIAEVAITNTANANQCTPVTNPGSNTINFTSCNLGITTSETTYKIRITPKTHANMPAPPGASYAVNGIVSAFTVTNPKSGRDSGTGIITIDNLSPNSATATSGSASDQAVTINWTSTNNETTNSVLLRWTSGSAGAEVPAEGASYTAGNAIGTATVACVVSSVAANTPLSRTNGLGGSAGCTTAALTNGTNYSYKIFQQDSLGNYDTGVVISGSPFTPQPSALTTIGAGASEPSNQTIGPGASVTGLANFTLRTNIGTDTMTAATVTLLPAGAFNNIAEVAITNTANANQCTPVTNPVSNTISFTGCSLGITTSETTYKIRITPKTHANMTTPPGASYDVTGTITAFTTTNPQAGSDTGSATITIDNLSPNSATATSGSASDQAVTINWTSTNNETTNSVLLRWAAGSAGADVPAEGSTYTAGNTIGGATVACVVSSVTANTPLTRTDGSGASAGCTNTPLTNGTDYSYKIFQQDARGNYDVGVVISGSPFSPQAAAATTIGAGAAEPSNQTIGPGASATDLANFTLRTNVGTDTMTAATVTLLPAGAFNNIAEVAITNTANANQCTPVTNPGSNTINFSSCSLGITTTETTYKIRITPKTHANMAVPPGASYSVTGTVTAFTTTNPQSGSDTGSATITIDNLSPNSATTTSGSASDQAVTINWTSTNNETTNSVLLRWTASSAGADVPVEGASYTAGNTIGGATVACVVSSVAANTPLSRTDGSGASAGCTNTPLTNGTDYSYKIFQQDARGNYDVGVVISGSPFSPQATPVTTLGAGAAEPSNQTIGPGASATDLANFTLRTNVGTDTMTAATVTLLPAGAFNNIAEVAITNTANANQCTPVTNPGSNTINFTSCSLGITTSETTYKIRITPKTHANMAIPPGASYAITGVVSAFTTTNSQAGSDTGSGIITIDNLSPNNATATSGSAGDQAVTLNWTSTNNETTNSVLLRWTASSAGADVPAEGASYTAGNTIGGATVACVVSSVTANTSLTRTDGSGASAGCTNTPLTNGTDYSYKIFQQDARGNYNVGVVISGSPFSPQVSAQTTLGAGATEPSNQTIGPGNAAVDMANFTLQTNVGTDTMTAATVTLLPAGAYNNIAQVAITDTANTNQCTVISNPVSNIINFTSCSLGITTSETTYKIRLTPKVQANMPVPPGESYSVTGTVTALTTTNSQSGSDTGSAIITIDNLSPNNATNTSGSAGDQAVTLNWTSTNNETTSSVIFRWTGASSGAELPTEGITYTAGDTIGAATVACVASGLIAATPSSLTDGSGGSTGCLTIPLTNNTEYSYKIFQQDSFGNYDLGVGVSGSPFMPSSSPEPEQTNDHNVRGKALTDEGDFVYFNCLDEPRDVFPFIFTFFFSVDPCSKVYNLPGGGTLTNYGVNLNDDYTFSGYARHLDAPSFGLISFRAGIPDGENYNFVNNCADTTSSECNATNNCSACYDEISQRVYGWAKVLADDSWIRLDASVDPLIPTSIYNYDATNPGFFFGYATHPTWGKLSLNCENTDTCLSNNYKVYLWLLNLKELSAPNWNFSQACSIEGSLRTVFRWKRTSGQPTAFQILINTENSTSTAWTSPKITGAMGSASQYICPSVWCSPSPALEYGTSYYWWLKLYDDNLGIESDWLQFNTAGTDYSSILTDNIEYNALVSANPPLTFTTYRHLFPQPFFEWSPLEIIAGTTTDFWTSTSTHYYSPSSPTSPIYCWEDDCGLGYQWASSHGSFIASTTMATTTIIFGEIAPGQTSSLTITDPTGYSCTRESSILTINYDLPLWREVKPD